ncbi:MAG: phosphate transporter transrane protein [Acidimicrobiaceae bacterium]|jgi:phosphate transport system permease protein|nr:phosphate transporter transrane protein [Acidimicrobiaceae bacterium]
MSTAAARPERPSLGEGSRHISPRRRLADKAWWGVCAVALLLVIVPVFWVLEGVVQHAVGGWSWSIFTTTSTGVGGGLANAIVGTFVLLVGVAILAGLAGIGCGIYLAEIARQSWYTTLLRSASEVLAGIPSIVLGYVGYVALVVGLHWKFSLLAGLIVLSVLVVPYVAKSTELALNQVPLGYREGGEALGMPRTLVLRRVVLRSAVPGIATGLIIALAISVGETAPLLYTAGWSNSYPSSHLIHAPIGYLTYASYTFFEDPSASVRALSYDASLLLVVLVLGLILVARLVVRLTQKYAPDRGEGGGRRERRAAKAHAAK